MEIYKIQVTFSPRNGHTDGYMGLLKTVAFFKILWKDCGELNGISYHNSYLTVDPGAEV